MFDLKEKTNNQKIYKFNDNLEMISLELDGSYPWSGIALFKIALSIDDIVLMEFTQVMAV